MQRVLKYLFCAMLLTGVSATAWASSDAAAEETLDVKDIIFSHIGDSYEWHITTWGDTHVTIPLPVIVRGKESGWHIFSSAKLHHGPYKGFYLAEEGAEYAGKVVEMNSAGEVVRPFDISYTKNALALTINSLILVTIILWTARWYRKRPGHNAPGGLAGAVEMFVMDINDNLIKPCIGPDYKRYAPYLLTAFFFILVNNFMGLIPFFPGGASTTGNIAVTLVLAICTFIAVNFWGNREYWKEIFWPDVPIWLKVPIPLMPAIELFGVFTKPFALMIRLFANVMAGHAVILGLMGLIFITVAKGPVVNTGMTAVSLLMSLLMNCLELLIAYIQAYVFTMLSAVFIGLSRQESHHEPKPKVIKTK